MEHFRSLSFSEHIGYDGAWQHPTKMTWSICSFHVCFTGSKKLTQPLDSFSRHWHFVMYKNNEHARANLTTTNKSDINTNSACSFRRCLKVYKISRQFYSITSRVISDLVFWSTLDMPGHTQQAPQKISWSISRFHECLAA